MSKLLKNVNTLSVNTDQGVHLLLLRALINLRKHSHCPAEPKPQNIIHLRDPERQPCKVEAIDIDLTLKVTNKIHISYVQIQPFSFLSSNFFVFLLS